MEFLTRKVGPLPMWAYLAGAAGLYLWWRRRSTGGTPGDSVPGGVPAEPAVSVSYGYQGPTPPINPCPFGQKIHQHHHYKGGKVTITHSHCHTAVHHREPDPPGV